MQYSEITKARFRRNNAGLIKYAETNRDIKFLDNLILYLDKNGIWTVDQINAVKNMKIRGVSQ